MKYKVGQRVIGLRGIAKGKTGIIGATWQSGYGVTFPESGNHNMRESSIMGLDEFPTIVELQAENERLRTALESALNEAKQAHALSTVQNYEEWIESIIAMLEKEINHATP